MLPHDPRRQPYGQGKDNVGSLPLPGMVGRVSSQGMQPPVPPKQQRPPPPPLPPKNKPPPQPQRQQQQQRAVPPPVPATQPYQQPPPVPAKGRAPEPNPAWQSMLQAHAQTLPQDHVHAARSASHGPQEGGARWTCPACTFSNPPLFMACEVCTAARPAQQAQGAAHGQAVEDGHAWVQAEAQAQAKQRPPPLPPKPPALNVALAPAPAHATASPAAGPAGELSNVGWDFSMFQTQTAPASPLPPAAATDPPPAATPAATPPPPPPPPPAERRESLADASETAQAMRRRQIMEEV
jgi:hypothetical protein